MLALQEQTEQIARFTDQELIESLQRVLSKERGTHARLLLHLGEVDARGLYREHAYGSMFNYCVLALHMSEAEAYLRIGAARLGRDFPRVLLMLAAGELHLSALKLLSPVLNKHNADELLDTARFKSKRELEALLAARFEKPAVPNEIRKLPQKSSEHRTDAPVPLAFEVPAPAPSSAHPNGSGAEPSPQRRFELQPAASPRTKPSLDPLGSARYKLQLTAGQKLHDQLQQARELMRHELPDGDLAQIVEKALDLLIADRMKRRFGVSRKPRVKANAKARAPNPNSRHIPHEVRREVIARDGTQCTFVSADGHRCAERGWLELHHEQPFGRGGPPTTSNMRVLCHAHNELLAERDYGRAFIRQRMDQAQRDRGSRQLVPGRARQV